MTGEITEEMVVVIVDVAVNVNVDVAADGGCTSQFTCS
jgi:hypothetical protein